jgi:hypothetical protein
LKAVSNRRLSMRKIKEILRFHHEMGSSRRQIDESLQIAHSTVGDVIRGGDYLIDPVPFAYLSL